MTVAFALLGTLRAVQPPQADAGHARLTGRVLSIDAGTPVGLTGTEVVVTDADVSGVRVVIQAR